MPRLSGAAAHSSTPLELKRQFRGVLYVLREVDLGRFEDIEKQATSEFVNADGVSDERIDPRIQNKLLLDASLIEGKPSGGISNLRPRIFNNLIQAVRELYFWIEPDELSTAPSNGKADAEEDDGEGND